MSELAVGGGVGGLVVYGTKLLHDLAGPTAKAVGTALGEWTEYKLRNWLKIAEAAETAVGDDPPPGGVHPRVLSKVLEDGTWSDDEVTLRYLGGVLAASRTDDARDTRGTYYATILTAMTPEQVRLHHILYSAIANDPPSTEISDTAAGAYSCGVRFDISALEPFFPGDGETQPIHLVAEAVAGLDREQLVSSRVVGDKAALCPLINTGFDYDPPFDEPTAVLYPSVLGCLLYLWACGIRTGDADRIRRAPRPMLPAIAPMVDPVGIRDWFNHL